MLPPKKSPDEQAAEKWGIDLSLLEENLHRSPTERLILHQSSLITAVMLQEAVKNARTERNPKASSPK
jgi:hypothetical protein